MPARKNNRSASTATETKKRKLAEEQKEDCDAAEIVQLSQAKHANEITNTHEQKHNITAQNCDNDKTTEEFPPIVRQPINCVPLQGNAKLLAQRAFEQFIRFHLTGIEQLMTICPEYDNLYKQQKYPCISDSYMKLVNLYHQNNQQNVTAQ